jgi:hypothetical protein
MRKKLRILLCCVLTLCAAQMQAAQEQTVHREQQFESLTIGTQTYSNVTVTTQNKHYVFLLHSRGMLNIKVAELPLEVKQLLGYEQKPPAPSPAEWAKQTLVKLDQPEVKQFQEKFAAQPIPIEELKKRLTPSLVGAVMGFTLLIYLFFCYCSKLICKKAGHEPGALIWFPILQMIPLLRAAGMSPLWLLAFLVPVLNLVAQIVWCVKIAKARGKGAFAAIFLILPFTNLFAFLYLAFSDGNEPAEDKKIEIMTLEAA